VGKEGKEEEVERKKEMEKNIHRVGEEDARQTSERKTKTQGTPSGGAHALYRHRVITTPMRCH
jgi:hypothetical protein